MKFFAVRKGETVESVNLEQVRQATIEKRTDGSSVATFIYALPGLQHSSHVLDAEQAEALAALIGAPGDAFFAVISR